MHGKNRRPVRRFRPQPLTNSERRALLEAMESDATAKDAQDLCTLVLHTGLRTGEIRALRVDDIDFATKRITVRASKASRGRKVPFGSSCATILHGRVEGHAGSEPVFAQNRVELAARKLACIAEQTIGRRVHVHHLRQTFAFNLLGAGLPLPVLAVIGGWNIISVLKFCVISTNSVSKDYDDALSGYIRKAKAAGRDGNEWYGQVHMIA